MADRYLRAYFHTFEPTGCDAVDAILEAIAIAGKAYHNTMEWSEEDLGAPNGYWALIQQRANEAARGVKEVDRG